MERDIPIIVVKNSTGKGKEAITTYNVELQKLEDSKAVRLKFGSFFIGGSKTTRPQALKEISIRNRVTPATLTRVNILKVLAERYRTSNPGATVKVIGYDPRPLIKLVPPEGVEDRRVMTYDFLQAIKNLPTNFTPEEREFIINRVSPKLYGKLRSLFRVISDDMVKRKARPAPKGSPAEAGGSGGPKGGHQGSGSKGSGSKSSRNPKRGATSPASGTSEKQKK